MESSIFSVEEEFHNKLAKYDFFHLKVDTIRPHNRGKLDGQDGG